MTNCDDANPLNLRRQAEWEMAAFLMATADVLGPNSRWLAADAWLRAMESLGWPEDNHQKFFRRVSIQAASQIVSSAYPNIRIVKPGGSEAAYWLPALQTGH
jgi:hypothetical protein